MKIPVPSHLKPRVLLPSAFSLGALFPMLAILLSPQGYLTQSVALTGVLSLFGLGALSSYFSGTSMWTGAFRVTLWGIFAMLFCQLDWLPI